MYHMSESEFRQYERAEWYLRELQEQHALAIQQAYDGVHPTRTAFNYGEGKIYSESVNTADYAIYLIELKEEHARQEKWLELRANAYRDAVNLLTKEDNTYLKSNEFDNYEVKRKIREKLKVILSGIISTRVDLQRQLFSFDYLDDVDEYDQKIEKMSEKELLKDYWSLDEQINEDQLKEQCIRLYEVNDMTFKMVGKVLGIETSRVKKYVKSSLKKVNKSNNVKLNHPVAVVNGVKITYLSPLELNEYRNGKKGGTKWYSYTDYLRMKNKGMKNKEIAAEMGIEPSLLSRRVRAWEKCELKRLEVGF